MLDWGVGDGFGGVVGVWCVDRCWIGIGWGWGSIGVGFRQRDVDCGYVLHGFEAGRGG